MESLRKELQEKQDLLCQAAKAMELMEDSQRKAAEQHRVVVNNLEQRLDLLQQEIKQLEAADRLQQQHNMTRSRCNESGLLDFLDKMEHHQNVNVQDQLEKLEVENRLRQCSEENQQLCEKITNLHQQLDEKDRKISAMDSELSELRYECAELKDKVEESEKSTSDVEVSLFFIHKLFCRNHNQMSDFLIQQMSKLLQNSLNVKEERIIFLNLENKVLKAMKQHLNDTISQMKEENSVQLQIISDQKQLMQEMNVLYPFFILLFRGLFFPSIIGHNDYEEFPSPHVKRTRCEVST